MPIFINLARFNRNSGRYPSRMEATPENVVQGLDIASAVRKDEVEIDDFLAVRISLSRVASRACQFPFTKGIHDHLKSRDYSFSRF